MIIGHVFRGRVINDSHEYRSELYDTDEIHGRELRTHIRHFERPQAVMALLSSCHELRQEGLPILYRQNTVVVPHGYIASLLEWLDNSSGGCEEHI